MSVNTDSTGLSYAIETTPGVVDAGSEWRKLQPNDIGSFGATITTEARDFITDDRMGRKGAVVDLDSEVSFDSDLTFSAFNNFAAGFLFSKWKTQVESAVASVTVSSYEHVAGTALTAGSLIFARDNGDATNDGLKVVDTASTTTSTKVVETLVVEASSPTAAKFDLCGVQGVAGDFELDASLDLISVAYDFTAGDLDFYVGQMIYIGGGTALTSFPTAGDGPARITAISANKLTLDKVPSTFVADAGAGTETIQIFAGSWLRNVARNHADFANVTYQFETSYRGLETIDEGFEYAIGNQANTLGLNMPLSAKSTVSWGFTGLDQEKGVDTAKVGDRVESYDTDAYNTTSDFVRISLANSDGTALAAYFKDLTINIANNVNPEKVLGVLGALVMNVGKLDISGTTEVLFNSFDVVNAVRDNDTVSLDWGLKNDEGALHFDIPSMTLGNGQKTYPRGEAIKVGIDGMAFKDDFFGYVMSITKFPYLP